MLNGIKFSFRYFLFGSVRKAVAVNFSTPIKHRLLRHIMLRHMAR